MTPCAAAVAVSATVTATSENSVRTLMTYLRIESRERVV